MPLVWPSFNFLRTYMQFLQNCFLLFSIVLYVYNYSQYLWWLRYLQLTDIHFLALVLTYPLSSKQIEVNTYCDEKILNEFFDLKTKFFFYFFCSHSLRFIEAYCFHEMKTVTQFMYELKTIESCNFFSQRLSISLLSNRSYQLEIKCQH